MKIKFTQDYQGRETQGMPKEAGDQLDCGVAEALELIRLGVAEEVDVATAPFGDESASEKPAKAKPKRKRGLTEDADE